MRSESAHYTMNENPNPQTAIITGASRGIGEAIALALGAQGMHLGLVARSEETLEDVARRVEQAGGKACAVPCDIANADQIEHVVSGLHKQLGRIDCLINNAGTFIERSISDLTVADWEQSLRVNLTAPFAFAKAALSIMAEQGGGRIINIGSTASHQGYLHQAAYCASKHGLLGLSRVLAIEGKTANIRVTTLCPGGVDTTLIDGTYLGKRLEGEPKLESDDIAQQVLFVLQQPPQVDIPEILTRRFAP